MKIEQKLQDIQSVLIQAKVTNPQDIHSNILPKEDGPEYES